MGLTELKRELRKLDKDQLIGLISDLYKKEKSVQQLLDFDSFQLRFSILKIILTMLLIFYKEAMFIIFN